MPLWAMQTEMTAETVLDQPLGHLTKAYYLIDDAVVRALDHGS